MTRILAVTSSPAGENSKTTGLVNKFVDGWTSRSEDVDIDIRNVGATPPPHIDAEMIGSYYTAPDERSDAQQSAIAYSDELVDELISADVVVIGAPMHNFGITSSLKTWFDHITRVGRSFRYTENGPEGLLKDKKIYVITAAGGNYSKNSPVHAMDHQTPLLKTMLGFIGLNDVTFIHAYGVAGGDLGIQAAEAEIASVIRDDVPRMAA
jgi:FMN-dependent NADH-azoreductase